MCDSSDSDPEHILLFSDSYANIYADILPDCDMGVLFP